LSVELVRQLSDGTTVERVTIHLPIDFGVAGELMELLAKHGFDFERADVSERARAVQTPVQTSGD
jgi:hypothetical protein